MSIIIAFLLIFFVVLSLYVSYLEVKAEERLRKERAQNSERQLYGMVTTKVLSHSQRTTNDGK